MRFKRRTIHSLTMSSKSVYAIILKMNDIAQNPNILISSRWKCAWHWRKSMAYLDLARVCSFLIWTNTFGSSSMRECDWIMGTDFVRIMHVVNISAMISTDFESIFNMSTVFIVNEMIVNDSDMKLKRQACTRYFFAYGDNWKSDGKTQLSPNQLNVRVYFIKISSNCMSSMVILFNFV